MANPNPFASFIPDAHHADLGLLAGARDETVKEMVEQFVRKLDLSSMTDPKTAVGTIFAILMAVPEPIRLFASYIIVGLVTRKLPKGIRGPTQALLAGGMTGAQLAMQQGKHASIAEILGRALGITPTPGAPVTATTPTTATAPAVVTTTPAPVAPAAAPPLMVRPLALPVWQENAINLLMEMFDLNIRVDRLDIPGKPRLTYRRLTEVLLKQPGLYTKLPNRPDAWYVEPRRLAHQMKERAEQLKDLRRDRPDAVASINSLVAQLDWAKARFEGEYYPEFGNFFLHVDAAAEATDWKVGDGLDRLVDATGDLLDRVTDPEMREHFRANLGWLGRLAASYGSRGLLVYVFALVAVGLMFASNLVGGLFGALMVTQSVWACALASLVPHVVGLIALVAVGGAYYQVSNLAGPWRSIVSFVIPPLAWIGLTLLSMLALSGGGSTFAFVGPSVASVVLGLFWGLFLVAPLGMVAELIRDLTHRAGDSTLLKVVDRFLHSISKGLVKLPEGLTVNLKIKNHDKAINYADHLGTIATLSTLIVLWIVTSFHWGRALALGELQHAFGFSSIGLIGIVAAFEIVRRNYWTLFATEVEMQGAALNVKMRYATIWYVSIGAAVIPIVQTLGTGLYWWLGAWVAAEVSAFLSIWWFVGVFAGIVAAIVGLALAFGKDNGSWTRGIGAVVMLASVVMVLGSLKFYDTGSLANGVDRARIANVQFAH